MIYSHMSIEHVPLSHLILLVDSVSLGWLIMIHDPPEKNGDPPQEPISIQVSYTVSTLVLLYIYYMCIPTSKSSHTPYMISYSVHTHIYIYIYTYIYNYIYIYIYIISHSIPQFNNATHSLILEDAEVCVKFVPHLRRNGALEGSIEAFLFRPASMCEDLITTGNLRILRDLASGNLLQFAMENHHRNSGFFH